MLKKIKNDPRILLFTFLSIYSTYALIQPSFSRNIYQIFITMSTCILVDYLLIRFYKKATFFPFSGAISSFGIFLMCNSPTLALYPLLATITILSKHFITQNDRHIFNPNNFALVCGILFFQDKMTIVAGVWGGLEWVVMLIIALGAILIFQANRVNLVLSFLISFLIFAMFRCYILNTSKLWVLLPIFGPSFFLFTFYMLTDPRTTPNDPIEQILFGFLLATIDAVFRYNKNKYAPFLSLFILTGFYPFLKNLITGRTILDRTSPN